MSKINDKLNEVLDIANDVTVEEVKKTLNSRHLDFIVSNIDGAGINNILHTELLTIIKRHMPVGSRTAIFDKLDKT